MNGFVIDTNVLLVADRQHPQAGPECELNCVTFLNDIRNNKVVYLDDDDHIFGEYRKGLKSGSQPGVGWEFYKWLSDHRWSRHCRQIPIKPRGSYGDFEEFPDDPALAAFDLSDRKFVAVALASGDYPEIANAVDSDRV